jgi:hypothetical protein
MDLVTPRTPKPLLSECPCVCESSAEGQPQERVPTWKAGPHDDDLGHPGYVAMDVLLEDGRLKLLWHHELEEVDEAAPFPVSLQPRPPVEGARLKARFPVGYYLDLDPNVYRLG